MAELADTLFTLMPSVVKHINERLDNIGMTNTDYMALRNIDGPTPMKALASCMNFDPSYVTMVADRLEALGLIARQPHPTDRRVKNLVLTVKGKQLKTSIPETLWEGPNTFSSLSDADRRRLMALLARLVPTDGDG